MDKEIIETLLLSGAGVILFIALLYLFIWLRTKHNIHSIEEVKPTEYALVLGAGLKKNGDPSDILKDRVYKAANLYKANKVQYLVMSGSHLRGKDEPGAMQTLVLNLGVPKSAIRIDRNGISTIHSCRNIKNDLNPAKVIVVTQYYHLPRSLYLQSLFGVQAIGIPADIYKFSFYKKAYWFFREFFALPYNLIKYICFYLR